jgi:hypothetical protein
MEEFMGLLDAFRESTPTDIVSVNIIFHKSERMIAKPLTVTWTYHKLPATTTPDLGASPQDFYRMYLTAIYYGSQLTNIHHDKSRANALRTMVFDIANKLVSRQLVIMPVSPYQLKDQAEYPVDKQFRSTLYFDNGKAINRNKFPMLGNVELPALSMYAILASNQRELDARWQLMTSAMLLLMDEFYQQNMPWSQPGSSLLATLYAFDKVRHRSA